MESIFYFGPEKMLFKLTDNGVVESNSTIPFHGIISRGLLNTFIEEKLDHSLWYQYSPYLFDSLFLNPNDEFQNIKIHAENCKVLSFGQSALAVKTYTEHYCQAKNIDNPQAEIWNIKEGHTSSVWKITVRSNNKDDLFIINVARDYEAGVELKELSEKLMIIGNNYPDLNLAKVFEVGIVKDKLLPFDVVVTRNEWIENSFEIHQRKNKATGEEELLLVDRFLTEQNNPAHIKSIFGRKFSIAESTKIKNEVSKFLLHATECLFEKPGININEGDVIWNGDRAVVVSIT